jgi:hypothetical protein
MSLRSAVSPTTRPLLSFPLRAPLCRLGCIFHSFIIGLSLGVNQTSVSQVGVRYLTLSLTLTLTCTVTLSRSSVCTFSIRPSGTSPLPPRPIVSVGLAMARGGGELMMAPPRAPPHRVQCSPLPVALVGPLGPGGG